MGPTSADYISWFVFFGILYRGHNLIRGANYRKHILLKMVQGDLFRGGQHEVDYTYVYAMAPCQYTIDDISVNCQEPMRTAIGS